MELYEQLSETYDLMIDWPNRLRRESFFFRTVFQANRVRSVLDTACGTGMHAKLFAKMGLAVTASDPVKAMVEATRRNLGELPAKLTVARFDELETQCPGPFDCVTCLGNSLPHVLTEEELRGSLSAMNAVLKDGGLVITHGNNYDEIVANDDRIMPLRAVRHKGREYVFLRLFEGSPPVLTFNVLTLQKAEGKWDLSVNKAQHRALFQKVLERALLDVGFCHPEFYGAWDFSAFEPLKSAHCIAIARKRIGGKAPVFKEPVSAVNRIVTRDNGEPLVHIAERVPEAILPEDRPPLVREKVADMLAQAQAALPPGYRLKIREAFRSLERQREIYSFVYEKLRREHPTWAEPQLRRLLNRYVAPPGAKAPPGHSTGGAVDLTIADADSRDLDMTSPFEWGMKGAATASRNISPEARANRQLLIDAMGAAGFSNCADEWWHWSYGDSAWAARTGRHACCYGVARTE